MTLLHQTCHLGPPSLEEDEDDAASNDGIITIHRFQQVAVMQFPSENSESPLRKLGRHFWIDSKHRTKKMDLFGSHNDHPRMSCSGPVVFFGTMKKKRKYTKDFFSEYTNKLNKYLNIYKQIHVFQFVGLTSHFSNKKCHFVTTC